MLSLYRDVRNNGSSSLHECSYKALGKIDSQYCNERRGILTRAGKGWCGEMTTTGGTFTKI